MFFCFDRFFVMAKMPSFLPVMGAYDDKGETFVVHMCCCCCCNGCTYLYPPLLAVVAAAAAAAAAETTLDLPLQMLGDMQYHQNRTMPSIPE